MDCPVSSEKTQEQIGWRPTHASLIADIGAGPYIISKLEQMVRLRREANACKSLSRRIALITGARIRASDSEVARQFAESGYTVLLGARKKALGKEAAATLQRDGFDVRYISIDLEDRATIAYAAAEIEADFGHLDKLVNNAGIAAQCDALPSSVSLDAI